MFTLLVEGGEGVDLGSHKFQVNYNFSPFSHSQGGALSLSLGDLPPPTTEGKIYLERAMNTPGGGRDNI